MFKKAVSTATFAAVAATTMFAATVQAENSPLHPSYYQVKAANSVPAKMSGDAARLVRCDAARQTIQARFDREQEDQRAKALYERRLRDWIGALGAPDTAEALAALRTSLDGLREDARARGLEEAAAV